MCLYPQLINNPKYKSTKKNGGVIPPVNDERIKKVPIGCQNCKECRKQKAREWQVRMLEDIKTNRNGKFVTLTFSNESIAELSEGIKLEGYDLDNQIAIKAVHRFRERWRKEFKKSVRHWLITELGHTGTENIHLHGIIWTDESMEAIEKHWKYGWIWKGSYVNNKTVNYIIKYVTKQDTDHLNYKPIVLTSPGIGDRYTNTWDAERNKYKPGETRETYRTETGHKISLPIYWRNKIYTEEEREKLWIEKLDKEERWVNGIKVSTKNGLEQYWRVLKKQQQINKELGYGDDQKNWDKIKYEQQLRNQKIKERTEKAYKKDTFLENNNNNNKEKKKKKNNKK